MAKTTDAKRSSLFSRIAARLRTDAKPQVTTSDVGGRAETTRPNVSAAFAAETGRARTIEFCRRIYREDTRVKGIIHTLSSDAVNGGFTVAVTGHPKAQASADNLLRRLKLPSRLEDWTKLTLRDGDAFLEVTINADLEIVAVTHKPTLAMRRNANAQDQFDDPGQAYWLAENSWDAVPPPQATFFAEWQMIHARWDHDEGSPYGTPLFATASKSYKRLDEGEMDIAIRRKTRAGMKYLHVVEGANGQALDEYKKLNKVALDNPFAAVADFFSTRAGSITTIAGDTGVGQIEDVLHHIRTFWLVSPVPMSLLGYGQDLNRDVLDKQKEQYDEAIPAVTSWVETNFVEPLLHLQWLLDGIYPDALTYAIEWKRKALIRPADLAAMAYAAMTLKALGFGGDALITLLQRFLPGIDVRAALEAGGKDLAAPNITADAMDNLGQDANALDCRS